MAWDDFGFDSPASDFGSFDAYSGGSYSPQDYAQYGGNTQSGTGMQYDPISNGWSNSQGGQISVPQAPQQQGNWFTNMLPNNMGGTGGGWGANLLPMAGAGAGGSAATGAGANQQGGLMGMLPGLLGIGGSLASIGGQLASGGQGASQQRTLNNAGQGALGSANSMNATAATGQLPLQQMQMSLLQALQSGQGLPPGYQQLIEQAFQPQMGDLYTQAAEQGRKRGFFDAPATSPPGGAILGPGLANLQGQMAHEKLGLMQSLPQTFQNPINSQIGAQNMASQGLQNTAAMNSGSQSNQSIAPMIGQQVGAGLQGLGQAMGIGQNMGSTARIPLAKGGIVTKPTKALIGEAGPEAVIPLGHGALTGPGMPPQGPPGGQAAPPGLLQLILSLLLHQQASRSAGPGHIQPGGQQMGLASLVPQVQR